MFFLAAYIVSSFKPEYVLPNDLLKVALEVIGIFFGSKVSKKIYETKTGKELEKAITRQDVVIELIKKNGQVKREDVGKALEISQTTSKRLLNAMEKKGLIKQEGVFRSTYYVLKKCSLPSITDRIPTIGKKCGR